MKRKGASYVFRNLGQVWQMACRNRRGSCHAGKYFLCRSQIRRNQGRSQRSKRTGKRPRSNRSSPS
ncbi:hypothetical protein [Pseudomonas phage vB_Pa-PAC1]